MRSSAAFVLQWAVTDRLAIRSFYPSARRSKLVQFHERFETDLCAIVDSRMRSGLPGYLLVLRANPSLKVKVDQAGSIGR